ncbi:alpha/beta hydrolase [Rhodoblastus sp. 17X3]|uniref:alpha/beta fold hydrolase n=1 Tax=Rhodoblastus sp. 17X3 TaxID=3047026 RepID=UPI0024B69C9F|nr:alpha/beta hydrolase [Rhodoblastus sp. 17X3]MDI9847960.1 alpha/beta hydrolase [Rhodoblastus sp. 17X3]
MKTIFLPGAGGSAAFWRPVSERLPGGSKVHLAWPGLGNEPPSPKVRGFDDLVAMALAELDQPSNLVAQSMGGLVAVHCALQAPERIRRLVLVATSAGVSLNNLGASDWRPEYFEAFPAAAKWIAEVSEDLSSELPLIEIPTLLIWGDRDPISPLAIGQKLRKLLPHARLHVVEGGDHDLAIQHADDVARAIRTHLDAT